MRRLGLIVLAIAILLGGAAVWGLLNMQGARTADAQATVVVAARPIELGQTLTPDMLRMQPWPAEALPQGAFTQLADITGGEARVALRAIEPNEPILASRVSGAGGRATLSATIAEGHRAVAIRVNDVVGVGGFVLPGDFVDVLLTRPEGSGYNNQAMRTDLLIAHTRVLAIDQSANDATDDPQVARAVTIEVTPEDGQKVALASQIGTLSLALRRADDIGGGGTPQPRQDTIRIQDLRAEAEVRRAPTPAPTAPRRERAALAGPTVEIIREFTSNRAAVASE
jgi:pilus assembly protein CpaB